MRQEIFEQTLYDMSRQREEAGHEAKDTNGHPSAGVGSNGKSTFSRRRETSFRHQLTFEYLLRHVVLLPTLRTLDHSLCAQEESIHLSESASYNTLDAAVGVIDPLETNEIPLKGDKKERKRKLGMLIEPSILIIISNSIDGTTS